MTGQDALGNIVIVKFPERTKAEEKKKEAERILREQPSVKTVLEKTEKVKGRLRTIKTKVLAGKKTKEAIYKENGCVFKFDVEKCYFSPRLSNERLEVARMIKQGKDVLVLFAGVAPFSIVIGKNSKPKKIVSIELGKKCCEYAEENVKLNKLMNIIETIQGDVKKKVSSKLGRFDYIVMPRPQLKESFLKQAFPVSKKGTEIYYYDFGKKEEEIVEKVEKEARLARKKIKILRVKKAGDIAPYKHRFRVDFRII